MPHTKTHTSVCLRNLCDDFFNGIPIHIDSFDTLTPELVAVVAAVLIVVMVLVVLGVTVVPIPAVNLEPWPTSRGIR
jgi:hypothetical protein